MTVCWHVDDQNVSHIDPEEITKFGNWLSTTYGVSIAIHQGKVHGYLVMIFDFSEKGKVAINVIKFIKNIISDFPFPEEITAVQTSPAADHLFIVQDPTEAKPLPEKQARMFNYATAQLLFLSARAQCDIQPVMTFLTKRVKSPDKDNWAKVK
jgi:hypothetical protein